MDFITVIGILASIGTAASLVPQLIKIIQEKDAEGISVITLSVLIVGNALWVYYGALGNDLIIIIANSFSLLINIIICILKMIYKK